MPKEGSDTVAFPVKEMLPWTPFSEPSLPPRIYVSFTIIRILTNDAYRKYSKKSRI